MFSAFETADTFYNTYNESGKFFSASERRAWTLDDPEAQNSMQPEINTFAGKLRSFLTKIRDALTPACSAEGQQYFISAFQGSVPSATARFEGGRIQPICVICRRVNSHHCPLGLVVTL